MRAAYAVAIGMAIGQAANGLAATPSSFPFSEAVETDGLLYLSGQIGATHDGKLVSGGLAAQTRQAMDNIGTTLRRHGLGYGDLVKCTAMLTDMGQWGEFNRVYAGFFPDGRFPARSAFGVSALALGASVEIECTARAPNTPRAINAGATLGPYSQAIRVGRTIYISGVVAFDPGRGVFAAPDVEAQMSQIFANLDTVFKAAGISREDVVKTTLFLKNAADLAAANKAYAAYFSTSRKPARTSVPGADWGRPDILVEMEAVATAREQAGQPGQ